MSLIKGTRIFFFSFFVSVLGVFAVIPGVSVYKLELNTVLDVGKSACGETEK